MAKKYVKFMKYLAEAVYYGEGNTDEPECPACKETMEFYGGERPYGDGYWECPDCGYSVTENDINKYL